MSSLNSTLEPATQSSTATPVTPTPPPIVTDPSDQTMIFGALGLLATFIGVAIALLQLRHMQRQRGKRLTVYELAST
jgi:hypothetical protein